MPKRRSATCECAALQQHTASTNCTKQNLQSTTVILPSHIRNRQQTTGTGLHATARAVNGQSHSTPLLNGCSRLPCCTSLCPHLPPTHVAAAAVVGAQVTAKPLHIPLKPVLTINHTADHPIPSLEQTARRLFRTRQQLVCSCCGT